MVTDKWARGERLHESNSRVAPAVQPFSCNFSHLAHLSATIENKRDRSTAAAVAWDHARRHKIGKPVSPGTSKNPALGVFRANTRRTPATQTIETEYSRAASATGTYPSAALAVHVFQGPGQSAGAWQSESLNSLNSPRRLF